MEICIDSVESARNAVLGGAMRLEVCSALSEGGLTPSPGLIRQIKNFARIPIRAMIRVRKGNFVYSHEEVEAMLYDLRILKEQVDGFVFGALTPDGHVDHNICWEIISAARPLPVTFHRAFDEAVEPFTTMESIINLGFDRILTSGQKETALEGLELIGSLVHKAAGRIIIMPGAGISMNNIFSIKLCGAQEFHASARKKVYVGTNRFGKEDFTDVTDQMLVKALVDVVNDRTPG